MPCSVERRAARSSSALLRPLRHCSSVLCLASVLAMRLFRSALRRQAAEAEGDCRRHRKDLQETAQDPRRPAGDRVDRDDSLFPLGSGPLYLGWDPCNRAAVLPWRPAVRRVGAAKCFVYSDWEALLPNRVITAVSGRLQKILANYATKFAA